MDSVTIIENADDAAIADWLGTFLHKALDAADRRIAISVPGGSTPFPILERLISGAVDWSRIDVFPGDDRIVPEDHPASNTGKIRALLEPAGAQVHALEKGADLPTTGYQHSLYVFTQLLASKLQRKVERRGHGRSSPDWAYSGKLGDFYRLALGRLWQSAGRPA